ncbi:MAG: hypothetical protein AAB393_18220, partial [Bacteroidota bacterium]
MRTIQNRVVSWLHIFWLASIMTQASVVVAQVDSSARTVVWLEDYYGSTPEVTPFVPREDPWVITTATHIITAYPNVPIHPTTNSTQSEMSIAVHPLDANALLVSANASNWVPERGATVFYGTGWYKSIDGGSNWSGYDQPPTGDNSGDPAAAIGRNGFFYIGGIAPNYGQG